MITIFIVCVLLLGFVDYCLLVANKNHNVYITKEYITVQDCEDILRFENKSVVLDNGEIIGFVKEQ